jgi:hypothetical protein
MKQVLSAITTAVTLFILPIVSFAAESGGGSGSLAEGGNGAQVASFMTTFLSFISGVLIPVILGLAFLMFVWGVFKFFILGGSDEEAQAKGKSLMIYAVAGFVLILSFYGIVNILTNGIGTGGKTIVDPSVPVKIN